MKEEFLCPSHFHRPFSFGQNFPHWVLPPPISGPLVSERPEHMPWDMASKSQKRVKLVWVESWSRDKGGSWKALKKCTILCPSTVRTGGIRTPWGSLDPGQGGIFLRSLKSHHLEDCLFYKTERQASRFSKPGGEAKTKRKDSKNNLDPTITKIFCYLSSLPQPLGNWISFYWGWPKSSLGFFHKML